MAYPHLIADQQNADATREAAEIHFVTAIMLDRKRDPYIGPDGTANARFIDLAGTSTQIRNDPTPEGLEAAWNITAPPGRSVLSSAVGYLMVSFFTDQQRREIDARIEDPDDPLTPNAVLDALMAELTEWIMS